jgi:photosystem II stability/assembly factor-like uncharacterized protein
VFAVGDSDSIFHTTNGIGWDYSSTKGGQDNNSIWASGHNDIYIVGTGGAIYHSTDIGSSWQLSSTASTEDLWDVFGTSGSDVWVVGTSQVVFHNDGSGTFTQLRGPQPPSSTGDKPGFFGVWASGPNDVYAVGLDNTQMNGAIFHTVDSGMSWDQNPVNSGPVDKVWGFSANLIYAVGPNGLVLKGM